MNAVVTESRHDRVKLSRISHQSGHDRGRVTGISVSYLNHSGGDETGFHDKSAVVNSNSSKIHAAYRDKSYPLKTELIVLCTIRNLISREPICCKKNL